MQSLLFTSWWHVIESETLSKPWTATCAVAKVHLIQAKFALAKWADTFLSLASDYKLKYTARLAHTPRQLSAMPYHNAIIIDHLWVIKKIEISLNSIEMKMVAIFTRQKCHDVKPWLAMWFKSASRHVHSLNADHIQISNGEIIK